MAKHQNEELPATHEESPTTAGAGGGEGENIGKIRDILFGAQMRDYEDRFSQLEKHLRDESAALKQEMHQRFEQLESFVTAELEKLGDRLDETQDKSAKELGNTASELRESLAQAVQELRDAKADRTALAGLFRTVSDSLTTPS